MTATFRQTDFSAGCKIGRFRILVHRLDSKQYKICKVLFQLPEIILCI